jgi:hypothetical protein
MMWTRRSGCSPFDTVLLISADADFIPAIEKAKRYRKEIRVAFSPGHNSEELKRFYQFAQPITKYDLELCVFDGEGRTKKRTAHESSRLWVGVQGQRHHPIWKGWQSTLTAALPPRYRTISVACGRQSRLPRVFREGSLMGRLPPSASPFDDRNGLPSRGTDHFSATASTHQLVVAQDTLGAEREDRSGGSRGGRDQRWTGISASLIAA